MENEWYIVTDYLSAVMQIGEQNECYFEDFFLLHNFKHEIGDLKAIFLQDY